MNHIKTLICVGIALSCSACDVSFEDIFQRSPFDVNDGPLASEEINHFTSEMYTVVEEQIADCIGKEATIRAAKIGDPETVEPEKVELMPVEQWAELDKSGKRIILTQVIVNQAIVFCTQADGD